MLMDRSEPAAPADLEVLAAAALFELSAAPVSCAPIVRGHIHDTFVVTVADGARFLLQRLSRAVFRDIDGLMHNIALVTSHLARRPGKLEALRLVRASGGATHAEAADGTPWRAYHFIEGARTFDEATGTAMARSAAAAFADFQARLADIDVGELRETIPRFFDSEWRKEELDAAEAEDASGRAAEVSAELDFVDSRGWMLPRMNDALRRGLMPSRVVHGDTKLNNILFAADGTTPRCIVDLDTCMPGYSLFDFGDLVRITASTGREDELDLGSVTIDVDRYGAIEEGYLSVLGDVLTPFERENMAFAARLVTLTIGMRFLADHIAGDTYFKVSRDGQNLDRARVQFRLVSEMERWL